MVLLSNAAGCDRVSLFGVWNISKEGSYSLARVQEREYNRGYAHENSTPPGKLSPTFKAVIFGAGGANVLQTNRSFG